MTDQTTPAEPASFAARIRRRLRSLEPIHVALLGLLAIPGYLFDSLAALQVFWVFFLALLWPLVAPLVELALGRAADAEEAVGPTDWIETGDWRTYAAWYLMLPLTILNPLVLAQDTMQFLGAAVAYARHRGSMPAAGSYEQRRSYRLPFDGRWTVVNGSYDRDYSHSWFPVNQRYAYDFVITDTDGRTSPEGSGSRVESSYCYDEPVLAPADGAVIDVCDSAFESSRGGGLSHLLKRDIRGNYVVIQHAPDEYSCLAHLVPGSVGVEPGDRVTRGQRIGRCGHTGNSSDPHLHFQLQDHPDFEIAAGLPVAFDDVDAEWPGAEAPIDDPSTRNDADGARTFVTAGQRVAHVDRDGDASSRTRDITDAASETHDAGSGGATDRRRAGTEFLQRVAFGACVGGVVTYFVSIVASWLVVAEVLAAGAALGVAYRLGLSLRRGDGYVRRPGSIGTVVGAGLVATAVAWYGTNGFAIGVGLLALGASTFLAGFVVFLVLGEYDGRRLRASFADAVVRA